MGRGRVQVDKGSWIKVYWDGDDTWYNAEVTEFDPVTEWCKVLYEDGEREEFRLSEVKYKKLPGGKMRQKDHEDGAGSSSEKHLRYINHTLVDMADRLPEFAVREDCRQWWEEWQNEVVRAADSHNLVVLVELASTFGEQITVFDIEGKVDVTTAWWKAQSEDWLAKLKEATNYEDVAIRVKDLLLRAVDWTAARNLFTSTGGTDINTGDTPLTVTREEDTVTKELKRKQPILETMTPVLGDLGFPRVEADVVCNAPRTCKRRKTTGKTLGEVTQVSQRLEKEVNRDPQSRLVVLGLSKITKKRSFGGRAEFKTVDVQVQEDFGMAVLESRFSSIPVNNLISPFEHRTFLEEQKEVQIPTTQSEKFGSATCFSGSVVGGKKLEGKKKKNKKKLQEDTGKRGAGNLGKRVLRPEAHVTEKTKTGRRKKIQSVASIADVVTSVNEGSICKEDVSPNLKEQLEPIHHHVSRGSSMTKMIANAKEDLKVTTSAVKGSEQGPPRSSEGAISVTKQKKEVLQATATRFGFRRTRGRVQKVEFGLNLEVPNKPDLDRRPRQTTFEAGEAPEKQQKAQDNPEEDTIDTTVRGCSPLTSEKIVAGLKKGKQQRKPGRPRKESEAPVMESDSYRNIDNHGVGGTAEVKDDVVIIEDVDVLNPRIRGRPRRTVNQETCSVRLLTWASPQHNEGEKIGTLSEAVPQRLLSGATIQESDDSNVSTTGQEDSGNLSSMKVVDQTQMQEELADAAGTKRDDDAYGPIVFQFTPSPKKRCRSQKIPVQVEIFSKREVTPPPSSALLSCVSKEDHKRSEALVSYKRRSRQVQNAAGSSKFSQEETADGGEKCQNQSAAVSGSFGQEEIAKNGCTSILQSVLSEEDQPETAFGLSRTRPSHVVSEGTLINSSNPGVTEDTERTYSRRHFCKSLERPPSKVVQDGHREPSKPVSTEETENKYSRRHFRKSPGRPPRKIVQDEPGESPTSASLSHSATKSKHVDLKAISQPEWKEVQLTYGKKGGTVLSCSRSRLLRGSAVAVIVEEQGNESLNQNHSQESEKGASGRAVNGDIKPARNESCGRFKRSGLISRSIEPQASQIPDHNVGCGAVPSSVRDNLQHDGNLIVSDETEVVNTSKKRNSWEKEKRLEVRTGITQGEEVRTTLMKESVRNGHLNEGCQFEQRTGPVLITSTTSMHETENELGLCEGKHEQQLQVAKYGLVAREAAAVKIDVPGPQSQSEVRLSVSPSDSNCKQHELAHLGEEGCVNVLVENCDESRIEEIQGECEELVKIQRSTTCSTDVVCREAELKVEPEYPSWGEKLCTDSDDDTVTLPVCGDSLGYNDRTGKSLKQELLKPNLPEGTFSQHPLATKTGTTVLEEISGGSIISELISPADMTEGVDSCVSGKVSNVASDIVCDSEQANGGRPLETNQTPNEAQKCVSPEMACNICNFKDADDQMLLCEERDCTCAVHTFCLNPPLQIVPTDAWTCLHCALMATQNKNVNKCSPKRFPPKKIQAVIGRRSNLVKDEPTHLRMEYLVKWDTLSHWHDTWIDATWFVGERKRYATIFESRHPDLPKIDVTKEIDKTTVDERKPEWLLIDRVIKCCEREKGELHPSELSRIGYKREGVQFLVKWQGLDYRNATWEETKFSKDMREAISAFISKHEDAEMDDVSPRLGESVAARISLQPDYIRGGSMYDYQIEGLKWLLSNFEARKNVVLADEMGLGKTVQAVAFISCVRNEKLSKKPVLVVAPKSTLSEWEQELKRWGPGLNSVVYQGEKQNRDVIRTSEFYTENRRPLFQVLLTSYELAIQDGRYLRKFHWAAIIVDEGHRMRNMRSKLGCALKEHQAEFRLLVTGTPMQNTVVGLFSLFHFLDPAEFPNPETPAGKFTGAVNDGNADSTGSEAKENRSSKFHELLRARMLRRVKIGEHGVRIPGKKIVEVPCSLTPFQRHLYTAVLKKNNQLVNRGVQSGLKRFLNNILTDLKMVCNHPYLFQEKEPQGLKPEEASRMMVDVSGKLLFLEKLLPMLKEGGHRVLLFSQTTRMLDIIERFLEFLCLSSIRIDGSTSSAERQMAIAHFNRPECTDFIFLSSTGAGGLEINLRSADTVIIYDPDFTPFLDLQAQARAHRIGQDKIVLVYQLVTEGSVEEKILERSKKKLALENMVVTSGFKGPNQTKETASDISDVLLHGLDHILNEHPVKAILTEHTLESVQKLLDRSILKSMSGVKEDYDFLGAVQGHEYVIPGAGKDVENHAQGEYGEKWRDLLSRLVEQDEREELGRSKGRRKMKYATVNVEGQEMVNFKEEGQEHDEYNPTSSDESSSDVSIDAERLNPPSRSRKSSDPRLDVGQKRDLSTLQKLPRSSVLERDFVGRKLSSFASGAAVTYTSQPSGASPQPHRVSTRGNLETLSLPLDRQSEILKSPALPGYTVTSSGLVYERVISSHGIGIHLNMLIPPARGRTTLHTPILPTTHGSSAVSAHTRSSVGKRLVQFSGPVPIPGRSGAGTAILRSGGLRTLQFAGRVPASDVSSSDRELAGGGKFFQGGSTAPNKSTNGVVSGRTGMPGGCESLQATALGPCAGSRSGDSKYSTLQSALSPTVNVSPYPTSCVNTPVLGNSVLSSGGQLAEVGHPPTVIPSVSPRTSCGSNGHPSGSTSNIQGSSSGMRSLQNSSSLSIAATYSTVVSVSPKSILDNVSTNPAQPRILSSARLKKSARNRHKLGVLRCGTQVAAVINSMTPTYRSVTPVLPAGRVGSSSRSPACIPGKSVSVADQSAVQLNSLEPPSLVPASCPPDSSLTDNVVSPDHPTPVSISNKASETAGITLTWKETDPCNPVGQITEEVTQGLSNPKSRETSAPVKSTNPDGVVLPPIVRAQIQRKPLWMPKGDAGLFMGPVRNM